MAKRPKVRYLLVTLTCIIYMFVTVSYKHLARGLEIVSVAIPMTSSYSIYLDNNGSEFSIQAASNSSLHLW